MQINQFLWRQPISISRDSKVFELTCLYSHTWDGLIKKQCNIFLNKWNNVNHCDASIAMVQMWTMKWISEPWDLFWLAIQVVIQFTCRSVCFTFIRASQAFQMTMYFYVRLDVSWVSLGLKFGLLNLEKKEEFALRWYKFRLNFYVLGNTKIQITQPFRLQVNEIFT